MLLHGYAIIYRAILDGPIVMSCEDNRSFDRVISASKNKCPSNNILWYKLNTPVIENIYVCTGNFISKQLVIKISKEH